MKGYFEWDKKSEWDEQVCKFNVIRSWHALISDLQKNARQGNIYKKNCLKYNLEYHDESVITTHLAVTLKN